MSQEQLSHLKAQLAALSPQEKLELARFLAEQARLDAITQQAEAKPHAVIDQRELHLAWLKANREQYAGKYVALNGNQLVGHGATLREANEAARQQGVDHPFLVHVSSEHDAPFGGW